MGLGIHTWAPLRKSWVGRRLSPERLFREIETEVRSVLQTHGQQDFSHFHHVEASLFAELHPNEEDVAFKVVDDRLVASARTSTAGPGYHAVVVEILDRLSQTQNLKWQFDDSEYLDETMYYAHRDQMQLEDQMAGQLQGLARHVLEIGGWRCWIPCTLP